MYFNLNKNSWKKMNVKNIVTTYHVTYENICKGLINFKKNQDAQLYVYTYLLLRI